jgi:serine/threonine protein kinase
VETQILSSTTDIVREQAARDRQETPEYTGGLLQAGENAGGYTIQRRISASGGEAEIYLCARDETSYILKYYYNADQRPKQEVLEKLKNFKHPDIIALIDTGEYKGRHFSILEYAEGGTLEDKNPDGTWRYLPVSEEAGRQIVRETINAFDACHKAGIIHRDIKPGNLFCKNTDGSDIVVGDFGISSYFDAEEGKSNHLTQTSARTEGYAAPEAYSGVIGPELDYYALGVTLWEILTGEDPFVNEKGQTLYAGQIMLDTMHGKVADTLFSRPVSAKISPDMQRLIRGLLTVRHDKRWGHAEVTRWLAGESVEVFAETRDIPPVEIGGVSCASYREIAQALLAHPNQGKNFIYKGKLTNYLVKIDQKFSEKILDLQDSYSEKNELNHGLIHIACSLCPNLPFPLDAKHAVSSLEDIIAMLESAPDAIIPWLREEERGFYVYLTVAGLEAVGKKILEIVKTSDNDFRIANRIMAALKGNSIAPFQDGVNNGIVLESLEHLYNLPPYLQERVLLFVERKSGFLPAWIENVSGRDLDFWYTADAKKRTWQDFCQFLKDKHQRRFV